MNNKCTYNIKSVNDSLSIDWNKVDIAPIDNYEWDTTYKVEAYAQMVYVLNYGFIVKLTSKESNSWATHLKDDDDVYLDSALEAFLCFDNINYINLEQNSAGYRLQGFGPDRHNHYRLIPVKQDFEVKVNKHTDYWEAYIYLPLDRLKVLFPNLKINKGYSFTGNFYKTGKHPITKEEHYITWQYIDNPTPDFHLPNQFGNLIVK